MPSTPYERHTTSNPYEHLFGYSRAVRKGQYIVVSGTTSIYAPESITPQDVNQITILHPESAYLQTMVIFKEALRAVEALGGKREDVVSVRMYVREVSDTEDVGRGLRETFGDVGPSATMILGVKFVNEEMRVEVELTAIAD